MKRSKIEPVRSFEDLEVWQQTQALRRKAGLFAKTLPGEERYRLVDQILRSSRSVTAHIAEGYGRFRYQEHLQYGRRARGSLYEILDHLTCALDEGYIDPESFKEFREDIARCTQLLNGYILYLQKARTDSSAREPQIEYSYRPIDK